MHFLARKRTEDCKNAADDRPKKGLRAGGLGLFLSHYSSLDDWALRTEIKLGGGRSAFRTFEILLRGKSPL
jgi:hypothetical protein